MTFDPAAIKSWLQHVQFWFLELQFVLLVALTWFNLPRLLRHLRLRPGPVIAVAATAVLTAMLTTQVAPRTNRIYYDEHIYQSIAQNLSDLHLAQMCNDGHVEHGALSCARGEYNKEPHGYPYLLSIPYRIFGTSEAAAHWLNAACTVLLTWVVFLITALLFGDQRAGVFAALVVALTPQHLLWSNTAAAEPSASLMAAVAVLTTLCHLSVRTAGSLAWMIVATVFAVQFRMEVILIVPIALLMAALLAPRELVRGRTLAAAAIGIVLGGAHLAHLFSVSGENWGAPSARFSIDHLWPNLAVNGHFYLGDGRFPVLFTLLAIVGLVHRPPRAVIVPAALFLAFWGIFLFFYAGSYNFGADVRFSLMSNAWLAVLAGRGASQLAAMGDHDLHNDRRAALAMTAAFLTQFLWYLPQVRSTGEEAWAARADVAFAHQVIPRLPPNSVVLTHNPSIFHLNGMNAAQMSLVTSEPAYVTGFLSSRFAGGVYLHWNAWCGYYDEFQQALCESTLTSFDHQLIAEYRERDFRYALYKLRTAGTIPKVSPPMP